MKAFRRASLVASFVLIACGGTPPQPKTPTTTPTTDEHPATLATASSPDLTPVQAPADLVAFGRLGNPGNVVDTVSTWAKFPLDVRQMIQKNEPEIGRLLVYDAPVEFAVSLDPNGTGDVPQPFAVFSVGLSSVEGTVEFAKHQGQSVRMVSAGVYRISKKSDGPACAVAPAIGKAPARLVCGDRDEDVDALLPYATRGLPSENMGNADLHVELRAEPVRRRYAKQLRQLKTVGTPFILKELSLDSPRFDRALADAVHGLADEILALSDDVDRIAIDAWLKKDSGLIEATTALKFKGKTSWTVQTMLDSAGRSKGVPDSFWKLPKDSEVGSYGTSANPKRYEPIKKTLGELVDGFLEHEKIPAKVRDQIVEILKDTWTTEGPVVYGHGEVSREIGAKPGMSGAAMRSRIRGELGWYVVGLEEKPAKYKAYFDKLVKLYNDAQLRALMDKRLHVKAADIPKLASRGGKGLPAGSTVYELSLPGAFFDKMDHEPPLMPGAKPVKRAPAAGLSLVLVVVPDGDRTWIGLSADEKTLTNKINEARKGEGTLSTREGLSTLKTAGGISGGFFTLENFVKSMLSSMSDMNPGADYEKLWSSMPHHGQTPMVAWTTIKQGSSTDVTWTLQAPKDVIEDIAAIAPALAANAMGGPGPVMTPPPPPPPPGRMLSKPPPKPRMKKTK